MGLAVEIIEDAHSNGGSKESRSSTSKVSIGDH